MGKGKGGKGGEGGKERTPVPDCEGAKVATLKSGGPPTMPDENKGPWSKSLKTAGLRGYYSRHRIKGRLNVVIQGDSDVILLHIYMSVDFFAAIL